MSTIAVSPFSQRITYHVRGTMKWNFLPQACFVLTYFYFFLSRSSGGHLNAVFTMHTAVCDCNRIYSFVGSLCHGSCLAIQRNGANLSCFLVSTLCTTPPLALFLSCVAFICDYCAFSFTKDINMYENVQAAISFITEIYADSKYHRKV